MLKRALPTLTLLLRHANSRTTMDLYTQAVSADKRDASKRQVEMLLA